MQEKTTTAIIAGATGLTGKALIREILAGQDFTKIKLITRKELLISDPRVEPILIHSLDDIIPQDPRFSADIYFCCLGTTIKKAGSRSAFKKVDFEAVVNFAKAAKIFGAKKFILVSAVGTSEKSVIFYSRVKAAAEKEVINLAIPGTCIFRPSLLMGEREEFRFFEALSIRFMRKIEGSLSTSLRKKWATNVDQLAKRMLEEALSNNKELKVIEAVDI